MTRYRHGVVTLTDSQLDPKVRGPAAGHLPNERIPNVLEEGCSSARTRAKCHGPEETPTACHLHVEIYER